MNIGDFKKLQYIPGALESHGHVKVCAHAYEKPTRALSPLADLEDLHEQEVKANAELYAAWVLKVHTNTHIKPVGKGETYLSYVFKNISIQLLAGH